MSADLEPLSKSAARELTDKIGRTLETLWTDVTNAYLGRAWSALGYETWDDYCSAEFGSARVRLPREERPEVVVSLYEAGLSIRAIAGALGASKNTVKDDLRQVGQIDPPETTIGRDGKTYTHRPNPGVELERTKAIRLDEQAARERRSRALRVTNKSRKQGPKTAETSLPGILQKRPDSQEPLYG